MFLKTSLYMSVKVSLSVESIPTLRVDPNFGMCTTKNRSILVLERMVPTLEE